MYFGLKHAGYDSKSVLMTKEFAKVVKLRRESCGKRKNGKNRVGRGKKDGERTSKRKTLLIAVSPSTTTQEAPLQSGQLPLLERG